MDKSAGPDEVHPRVIRELAPVIAASITNLFQCSLDTGEVPEAWRTGVVHPIFKGGVRTRPENYRPICMTSILVKLLEKFVRADIYHRLAAASLIAPEQHGFLPGRSCVTNLLLAREAWCDAVDHGKQVHVAQVDFSKAFDRVDHRILLRKLVDLGIPGQIVRWIASYLNGRVFRVRVGDASSNPVAAVSGVPQGSVLGPLLFAVYVNDLPRRLRSNCLLFADDLKLWVEVATESDTLQLQSDLDELNKWATENRLPINGQKSKLMAIGRSSVNLDYVIGSSRLEQVENCLDLGVVMQSNLKTATHSALARKKGLACLWRLRRAFSAWTPSIFRHLLVEHVRPVMEYGAPAFFPCTRTEVQNLEYVQRLGSR